MDRKFLELNEVATIIGCSLDTVRRWTRAGKIPCYYLSNRMVRVKTSDLEEFLQQRRNSQ